MAVKGKLKRTKLETLQRLRQNLPKVLILDSVGSKMNGYCR